MKIIGYILIFAGAMNIIRAIASNSGESNNMSERLLFGILFLVVGGLLVKYAKPKEKAE